MARDLFPVTPIRSISRAPISLIGQVLAGAIRDEHGAFLFDQDRQYIGSAAGTAAPASG